MAQYVTGISQPVYDNWPALIAETDPRKAVRRVMSRLEFFEYWAYRDDELSRWYAGGFDFMRQHHSAVCKAMRETA